MKIGSGVSFGIAGGANGGDILFHEVCHELGIPTHLYLAMPSGLYVTKSVRKAGRQTKGVRLMNLGENGTLLAIARNAEEAADPDAGGPTSPPQP